MWLPLADADDPLVDAAVLVPGLIVDLAYATSDNIVGRALYPADSKCLLRGSVAQRLAMAADALRKRGFRLVARDCTRSLAAQKALFAAHPHPGSVADPARGSLHARGAAADAPLPDSPAKEHREALKAAMHAAGFRVNPKEWWHYSRLYGWRWPLAP